MTKTQLEFGELLRQLRKERKKTMGDVANLLGVSVPFVSDVERGNRTPFSPERIHQIAKYLNTDPTPLLKAAAATKGTFELDAKRVSEKGQQFAASLMRSWSRLTEEQFEKLAQALPDEEDP